MTNILVLDNSEVWRAGITSLLEPLPGVSIFHGTEEWEIAGWYAEHEANVVILEAPGPAAGIHGRLQHIRRKFRSAVVILLTGKDTVQPPDEPFDADYVLCTASAHQKLVPLVREVVFKNFSGCLI